MQVAKTMTVAEQAMFTAISGNLGALHVDRRHAQAAGLADMAVFEMAAAALASTCLSRIAGPGYRIAQITLGFGRTICIGETVQAQATLRRAGADGLHVDLVLRIDGAEVSTGAAVMVPVQGAGSDV